MTCCWPRLGRPPRWHRHRVPRQTRLSRWTQPGWDPSLYRAYVPAACKAGQFFHYTCEFDASWAVLKTYGIDASLDEQFAAMEFDTRVEPYYEETSEGVLIHGGDIGRAWSGDYYENFLRAVHGTGDPGRVRVVRSRDSSNPQPARHYSNRSMPDDWSGSRQRLISSIGSRQRG